jgi:hypothetical protein
VNDCVDSPLVRGVKAATIGLWPVDASLKGITETEAAGAHKVCTIDLLSRWRPRHRRRRLAKETRRQ